MKKKEKEKIPVSNYVKLTCIIILTVTCALIVRNWYINHQNYKKNIPVITETLKNEINTEEVYSYVRENEDAILYMGVVNDENCRSFETKLNTVITEKHLENSITYLNITKANSKNKFIKEFNKFYGTDIKGYPSIIIFEEGEVKDILTMKTGKELKIEDAITFLEENEVRLEDYD